MSTQTAHAAYAKHVLHRHLLREYNERCDDPYNQQLPHRDLSSPLERHRDRINVPPSTSRIAVIGAGAAGLYIARILKLAKYENIDVLEASPTSGGRCYTYNFTPDETCAHNYYDVGAMRIPKISTMESTFNTIDLLNAENPNSVVLEPYVYHDGHEPSMYAYGQIVPPPTTSDPFAKFMIELLKQQGFLTQSGGDAGNFDQAFEAFMNSKSPPPPGPPDNFSTRAYLMGNGWTYNETELAETLNTSTGLFDQAFMETICDFFDFQLAGSDNVNWYRVDGGMSKLTQALEASLANLGVVVTTSAPVTAMQDNEQSNSLDVTVDLASTGPEIRSYDVVFNTTSFGCLQRMDIQGLNLDPERLQAIRALSYDRATKVAIKFSSAWWSAVVEKGGVSSTDLPISNVIYPSWTDDPSKPYVAIMSYSWAQDASRMAALISTNDVEVSNVDNPIIQLCFQNLVKLWATSSSPVTMQQLQEAYISHHAFAWSHNPYTDGGFALFGPGQFENLYPLFQQPLCNNKLWIAGEAVSCHHAWISGAFDSGLNAVTAWLKGNEDTKGIEALRGSPLGLGEGQFTAELDEKLVFWNLELADHGVKQ